MERIFLLNVKSELENFVVVQHAQSRVETSNYSPNGVMIEQFIQFRNFAHLTGNSAKWTFPNFTSLPFHFISLINFARIKNIFVNPNFGKEGLYSTEKLFELNSCN